MKRRADETRIDTSVCRTNKGNENRPRLVHATLAVARTSSASVMVVVMVVTAPALIGTIVFFLAIIFFRGFL